VKSDCWEDKLQTSEGLQMLLIVSETQLMKMGSRTPVGQANTEQRSTYGGWGKRTSSLGPYECVKKTAKHRVAYKKQGRGNETALLRRRTKEIRSPGFDEKSKRKGGEDIE